jgi:spore coat protein JB
LIKTILNQLKNKGVVKLDKELLTKNIYMLDFMAVDLQLFLNTHPENRDAIDLYNKVITNADKCRTYYEHTFGPFCSYRSVASPGWEWVSAPWPWENGEER